MSRRVLVPLVLFLAASGVTYGLARWHPAKPGTPRAAGGTVNLGDQYRGETVFSKSCAGCHGDGGKGGIGPRLIDDPITIGRVKAQIDQGGGSMPAGLVKGHDEEDVLAYVATIIAEQK